MPIRAILEGASEITHRLDVGDFKHGEITTRVKMLDGIPILPVPSARMKTKYVFNDGETAGPPDQTKGGFTAATGAKDINWIISSADAVIAVSKTDKTRVFSPDENQTADAWKLDYRKYHDLWILDNQFDKIRVNTK